MAAMILVTGENGSPCEWVQSRLCGAAGWGAIGLRYKVRNSVRFSRGDVVCRDNEPQAWSSHAGVRA